jgi:signal transduction histidine kinase
MERRLKASACGCWCRTPAPVFRNTSFKRAFEPYVTTKAKGTGLGLAVVKKIADEHAPASI